MMLLMLVVPLAFLARDSFNRYDPNELMIAAVTPANYCASSTIRSIGPCWSPRSASRSS